MVNRSRYIVSFYIIALFFAWFGSLHPIHAQDFNTKGLLRVNMGLGQAFLFKYDDRPVFADGFAEWYPEESISIKGQFLCMIGGRTLEPAMKKNYSVQFGLAYHFFHGKHDLSAGVQPGLSLLQPNTAYSGYALRIKAYPSLNVSINYSFFFSKFCHFYFCASQLTNFCRGTAQGSMNFSSFMLSGGLGFHLGLK